MAPDESKAELIIYNGVFRHGVDKKRRTQVPARWRPSNPAAELTVMIWSKHEVGVCLRVVPPEQLLALVQKLNSLPNGHPDKATLKRDLGMNSIQVAVDKAGRFCLPEDMAAAAGITDEAVFVGMLDEFEIWEPTRLANARAVDQTRLVSARDHLD